MKIDGQFVEGSRSMDNTSSGAGSSSRFDWGSIAQNFMPPSPTDIINKVLLVVGGVIFVVFVGGIIYLLTRKRKNKYE